MLKNKFKTILIAQVLIVWLILATVEIFALFFLNPKPMVWRAWEVASNYDGKDHNVAPFKPMFKYEGSMVGDLLNTLNFKSNIIRKQVFEVDEYGYRNRVGLLDKPVKAVIPGNSFVGGAQEDQQDLVSDILTTKYNIPTYNYATFIVKDFWHDTRFIDNPPKYLIVLGSEADLIGGRQNYEILNLEPKTPTKWNSYEEWKQNNDTTFSSYQSISQYLKNFSLIRYIANQINIEIINFNKSRSEVAEQSQSKMASYDPESDMIFFQVDYDNPKLGSAGKTNEDIEKAIDTLKKTQETISQRNMILIVAAMPSKAHLHSKKYASLVREERALVKFEEELQKNNIEHIKLFDKTFSMVNSGKQLYYTDDTHWNADANKLISEELAKKIKEIESKEQLSF